MNPLNQYKLYKGIWLSDKEHLESELSKENCKSLLSHGGFCVRNTFNFDTHKKTSFWYIIKDSFEEIELLSANTRAHIRKALRTYDIRPITTQEFIDFAYPVFVSAQQSYKVKCNVITQDEFVSLADSIKENKHNELWGVFIKNTNEMVALSINTINEVSCNYNTLKCKYEALHNSTYPYFGLFYEMNKHYLQERKLKYVNDGSRSITNHSNIQPFLIDKFKFRKAYCNIKIYYQWWLKPIITILYPFRNIIPIAKIQSLLNMEAMERGEI